MDGPGQYPRLVEKIFPIFESALSGLEGAEQLPTDGGFIIASNHVDWLDGFFIGAAVWRARRRPVYFLTRSKYYWWSSVILPIPKQKRDIVEHAAAHVRDGKAIVIFPEGQRNPTNQLLPGKTGVVRTAMATGAPVVPLGLTCPAGRNVGQSLLRVLFHRQPVRVRIGPPLTFSAPSGQITNEWLHQETQRLMAAIAPLCGKTTN